MTPAQKFAIVSVLLTVALLLVLAWRMPSEPFDVEWPDDPPPASDAGAADAGGSAL